jgi:hypothetical protein
MAERGITEAEVERVLAAPSIDYPSGPRHIFLGDGGLGKRVKVVTDPRSTAPDDPVIVTVADPDER